MKTAATDRPVLCIGTRRVGGLIALIAQCSRDLAPDVVLQIPHLRLAVTELTLQALRRTGFLAILSPAPRLIVSLLKVSDFVECLAEVADP